MRGGNCLSCERTWVHQHFWSDPYYLIWAMKKTTVIRAETIILFLRIQMYWAEIRNITFSLDFKRVNTKCNI